MKSIKKLVNRGLQIIGVSIYAFFLNGCSECDTCYGDDYIRNPDEIKEFHKKTSVALPINCNEQIDLYVDYSACTKLAENLPYSSFYYNLRAKLISFKPAFYSIKGTKITKERNDDLNYLFGTLREVDYADLKKASNQIVANQNQAILITDGEYFQRNFTKDHKKDPYLYDAVKKWLTKGNDLHLIAETYFEENSRGRFKKNRFYFIFTNKNIEYNLYDKIDEIVNQYSGQLKSVHLSLSGISVYNKYGVRSDSAVNVNLSSLGSYATKEMEYHYPQIGWCQMVNLIKNGVNYETGEPLPSGDFFLKGYKIDYGNVKYYNIKKLGVKVYDVYDAFRTFEYDSVDGDGFFNKTRRTKELKNIFQIDHSHYEATGEILLRIHENFTGKGLNHCKYDVEGNELRYANENLLRVDIVMEDVENTFNLYRNDFEFLKWQSIRPEYEGEKNESVYLSVKNVLEDESISPKIFNKGILYTIYIRTFPSNL